MGGRSTAAAAVLVRAAAAAHTGVLAACGLLVPAGGAAQPPAPLADASPVAPFDVVGDEIPASLTGVTGDPTRGRAIVVDRQLGLCLLCHSGPFPEQRGQGTLAPDLTAAGTRWTTGQLRLRLVDGKRLNPASIMPSYHRVEHLRQVGPAWRDRPILTAAQIEDVVAFLRTLGPSMQATP